MWNAGAPRTCAHTLQVRAAWTSLRQETVTLPSALRRGSSPLDAAARKLAVAVRIACPWQRLGAARAGPDCFATFELTSPSLVAGVKHSEQTGERSSGRGAGH